MVDYAKLGDDELIDLLFTEDDCLPRKAVDEFVSRGKRMIKPLSDIVSSRHTWTGSESEWWAVVHAVFILGAIGGKETVLPFMKTARWAVAYDCDWVTENLPSIFGKIGVDAVDLLKYVANDKTSDCYTRAIAMEGLAAITIYNPEVEKDIFPFIHSILRDDDEDRNVRQTAGHIIHDFLKSEYKDDLIVFAREERELKDKDFSYIHAFDEDDVEEEFLKGEKDLWSYTKDWLSFYDKGEIEKRQERWLEEEIDRIEAEREQKWRESASANEPIVRAGSKIGRNDPCLCGSGKKYKKCCMGKGEKTLH